MTLDDVFEALAEREAVLVASDGTLRYVGAMPLASHDPLRTGIAEHRAILIELFTYAPDGRCVYPDCFRLLAPGDKIACPGHRRQLEETRVPWNEADDEPCRNENGICQDSKHEHFGFDDSFDDHRAEEADRRDGARVQTARYGGVSDLITAPMLAIADARALPLPDGCVGLNVTSPPYAIDVAYPQGDIAPEAWPRYMQDMLAEAYRVAEPSGRLCLNVPFDVAKPWPPRETYAVAVQAAKAAGWQWRGLIVWNEDNVSKSTARGSVDSPSSPYVIARVEALAVFFKPPCWKRQRPEGVRADLTHSEWLAWTNGLWTFPGVRRAGHPAPFPDELPRRCIKLFSWPGDVVLDQHVGSGTTAAVAQQLGRRAVGFDISPEYIAMARQRCGVTGASVGAA